jgi:hypothetical protein
LWRWIVDDFRTASQPGRHMTFNATPSGSIEAVGAASKADRTLRRHNSNFTPLFKGSQRRDATLFYPRIYANASSAAVNQAGAEFLSHFRSAFQFFSSPIIHTRIVFLFNDPVTNFLQLSNHFFTPIFYREVVSCVMSRYFNFTGNELNYSHPFIMSCLHNIFHRVSSVIYFRSNRKLKTIKNERSYYFNVPLRSVSVRPGCASCIPGTELASCDRVHFDLSQVGSTKVIVRPIPTGYFKHLFWYLQSKNNSPPLSLRSVEIYKNWYTNLIFKMTLTFFDLFY